MSSFFFFIQNACIISYYFITCKPLNQPNLQTNKTNSLIYNYQEKHNKKSEFTMDNLVVSIGDLFGAGTETTSSTIKYGLLLLLKYPEVAGMIRWTEECPVEMGRQHQKLLQSFLEQTLKIFPFFMRTTFSSLIHLLMGIQVGSISLISTNNDV